MNTTPSNVNNLRITSANITSSSIEMNLLMNWRSILNPSHREIHNVATGSTSLPLQSVLHLETTICRIICHHHLIHIPTWQRLNWWRVWRTQGWWQIFPPAAVAPICQRCIQHIIWQLTIATNISFDRLSTASHGHIFSISPVLYCTGRKCSWDRPVYDKN